jgi:hypothetical protein
MGIRYYTLTQNCSKVDIKQLDRICQQMSRLVSPDLEQFKVYELTENFCVLPTHFVGNPTLQCELKSKGRFSEAKIRQVVLWSL